MSCAIDTNVLIDLVAGDQDSALRAASALEREGAKGALVVGAPVYAECLAHPGWNSEKLDHFLADTKIIVDWDLQKPVWIRAGAAFATYARLRARSGGETRRILADFLIGAHAESIGALVTRDLGFYKTYFSKLRTITP